MIRKLFPFVIILLSIICSCTSKNADKDAMAKNDSIKKYFDLAGDLNLDKEKRQRYNDIANSLVDLKKNDTLTRSQLSAISYKYYCFNENDKFKSTIEKLMILSIESNDSLYLGKAYRNFGLYYMDIFNNEEAMKFFCKSEILFLRLKKPEYLISMYLDKAFIYCYENNYFNCESSASKALLYDNTASNFRLKYDTYNLIAVSSNELKDFGRAIEYHKKVLKIAQTYLSDSKSNLVTNSQNNLGVVYQNLNRHNTAIGYFKNGLVKKDLIVESPWLYAMLLDNIGYSKLKLGDRRRLPGLFYEALKIREKNNINQGIIASKIHLSQYYLSINDTINAKKFALSSLKLAKSIKAGNDILISLIQLSLIDKMNASLYLKEHIRINDSIHTKERNAKDKFARIAFETDEITQEKNIAVKQKWIVVIVANIIILFIAFMLIITRQQAKQNELQSLQSQQTANEEIYALMLSQKNTEDLARQEEKQRIAIELHDGVMNRLASTRLNLSILSYKKDKETIDKCLGYVKELYDIEQEIRHISHDLNLEIFNGDNSFTSLLTDLISTQNNTTNTNYHLEVDKSISWIDIHSGIKMNLYRIIQEASRNINKFAQADNAIISFMLNDRNLSLSITDDGKGFDVEKNPGGIGLKNIKLRVNNLGGKLIIQSKYKNTSLNITIPII